MDSEKPPTRHVPGGIRDEPQERRHHHLRLDHLGAIEARLGHHRRVRYAGEEWTISYTPGKGGGTPAQDGRERGFARWSYPDPVFAT